jgi:hypothetical protein
MRFPWQFSLRTLCLVVFCCAIVFGFATRFGSPGVPAAGAAAGLVMLMLGAWGEDMRLMGVGFGMLYFGIIFASLISHVTSVTH